MSFQSDSFVTKYIIDWINSILLLHCTLAAKCLLFTRASQKVMMKADLVWNAKSMHCRFKLTSHPLRHLLICQRSDAGSIKLSSEVLIGAHLLALRRISLYEEENVRVYIIAAWFSGLNEQLIKYLNLCRAAE